MLPFVVIVAVALLATVAYRRQASAWALREAQRALAQVAEQRGFERVFGRTLRYQGFVDGYAVALELDPTASATDRRVRVTVRGGGVPAGLSAVWRQPGDVARGPQWLLTGDDKFDAELFVLSASPAVRAVLDRDARQALRAFLVEEPLHGVDGGVVTMARSGPTDPAQLTAMIEAALDLARKVTLGGDDVAERLAAIATDDPDRGCRRLTFHALMADHRSTPLGARVLRAAVGSGFSFTMRFEAARMLGDEGLPALEGLLACADPVVVVRACEALAARGHVAMEARLIAQLAHPELEVRVLAAGALGRWGTVAAVEPLLACGEASGAPTSRELRRVVSASVAAIQARLAGAGAGQVSVAATVEAGAVRVVTSGVGAVRVAARSEGGAVRVADDRPPD